MMDPSKMEAYVNEGEAPMEEIGEGGAEEGEGEGVEKYSRLIPLLTEFAEDVQDSIDEMDPDVLEDPSAEMSPDDETILSDGLTALDRGLQKELKAAGGISPEDAEALAESLVEGGVYEEASRLGGWLHRIGALVGGAPPEEEEEEGGEQPEEPAPEEEMPVE